MLENLDALDLEDIVREETEDDLIPDPSAAHPDNMKLFYKIMNRPWRS